MSEHEELSFAANALAEKALLELKDDLCSLEAPAALELYVERGIAKGRVFKRNQTRRRRFILAACLVIILLVPIRISPAYAALVSRIPGLDYIVRLINYDRGLVSAVQNDFVQKVDLSDEHEGIVFTVKDMIVDESRMVLFYILTDNGKHGLLNIDRFRFLDADGKEFPVSVTWSGLIGKDPTQGAEDKVEVTWPQGATLPDKIMVQLRLKQTQSMKEAEPSQIGDNPGPVPVTGKLLDPTWQVEIPINIQLIKNLKDEYVIGKVVTVEGQNITFDKVTVFPTRISVNVAFDPANTKKIFYFDDLCLVDERGNKATGIINGISGSLVDDNHQTLYFQSNYFDKPRELYLVGQSIRAVEKALTEIKVDLTNKTIVSELPDQRLSLADVRHTASKWVIVWRLKVDPGDERHAYDLFSSRYLDATGQEHSVVQSGVSTGLDTSEIQIELSAQDAGGGLVTLHLNDYPSRIKGEFQIKIK